MSSAALENTPALLMRIGQRTCALALSHVSEVLRPLPIEQVFGKPDAFLGLTILRGAPVPVIDAARLAGWGETIAAKRFVALRVARRSAVLAVDAVLGIRELSGLALEALPPLFLDAPSETVSRIGHLDNELLLVLRATRFVEDDLRGEAAVEATR
jgi:purine-binding chemotaxis protein CheW